MKKLLAGLGVVAVVGILVVGDALAQRGRGGRGGPAAGRGIGASGPGAKGIGGPPGPGSFGGPGPKGPLGKGPAGFGGGLGGAGPLGGVAGTRFPHPAVASHSIHNWSNLAYPPFSPAWYAAHPNAWRFTHSYADLWVAATAAGLATWLAVPAVPVESVVVVESGTEETSARVEDPSAEPAAGQAPTAAALAKLGAGEAPADAEWKPLGVFSLKPAGEGSSTRVIQLAVSREGLVRGSQFDTLTEGAAAIQGAVDKKSLRIAWTIGSKSGTAFETHLGELTKPQCQVTAHFSDGKSATWEMVRIVK